MARSKSVATKHAQKARKLAADRPGPEMARKKRRWRPNTVASREVRRYQRSVDPLIPKRPVRRIVQHMLQELSSTGDMRMTRNAFEQLYSMASTIMSETLGAAERVRSAENGAKSIRRRHMRVGRSMIGIKCLSDSQMPIERNASDSLGTSRKNRAVPRPVAPPVAPSVVKVEPDQNEN